MCVALVRAIKTLTCDKKHPGVEPLKHTTSAKRFIHCRTRDTHIAVLPLPGWAARSR